MGAHAAGRMADWSTWRQLRRHQIVERLGRIGHLYLPAGGETVRWSREAARIHGLPAAPARIALGRVLGCYAGEDRARLGQWIALAEPGRQFEAEAAIGPPGGERRQAHLIGETRRDARGRAAGLLLVVHDISGQKAAFDGLAAAEKRRADFAEIASDWLWETGPDLRFSYVSSHAGFGTGMDPEWHIGKTRGEFFKPDDLPPDFDEHLAALERREPFRYRYWRRGRDGQRRYISTTGKPIFDRDGTFLGYRGVGRDMTAEQQAREELIDANRQLSEAKRKTEEALASLRQANTQLAERNAEMSRAQTDIRHAALHDPLTGLPNRRYLDEKIADRAWACRRKGDSLAVLHVDLARFTQINDTLGHSAGDAVLCRVAEILTQSTMPWDFVARVGGDEFVVLCIGREDVRAVEDFARRLIAEFGRPVLHDGRECWFGACIGISEARGEAIRPAELLVNADVALHRAKSRGRGSYQVFSAELQSEIVRNKALADSVLAGLKRAEFVPYYQPQIRAGTLEIVGVEALARWRHPEEGVLAPGDFLRIAEDLGVVGSLDGAILETALDDLGRWREEGVAIPRLSINVSARRLLDRNLIGALGNLTLPQGGLAFELLETVFLDEPNDTMAWNIDMLKEMGIEIELDDFGSGHASIIGLVRLAPDGIKIDRELVSSVTQDRRRCDLVRSIVEIGRSLETRIIAEGVETGDQAALLHEIGCDALQGYHFAPPMAAGDFLVFARDWQHRTTVEPARRMG